LGNELINFRAGFYAENVLLYAPQLKEDKILPLPVGKDHKFAPVALGVGSLIFSLAKLTNIRTLLNSPHIS
jgi:hypothetical protein